MTKAETVYVADEDIIEQNYPKHYKASKYNFFFDAPDGTHLAFNAMSGGFAKITESNYPIIQRILHKPNSFRPDSEIDQELWNALLNGLFLVEKERDELAILKVRNRTARFNTSTLGLTIAPTLDCNFQCGYCYAATKNESMNELTQLSLVKFVKSKSKTIRQLNITWLGGEPLLAFHIIENLTNHIKKICMRSDIKYTAGIITNGYLLSQDIFTRLSELGLNFIQVTLDGPEAIHDGRRPLKTGGGTFNKIINNLESIIDTEKDVAIAVRVNIDKMNETSAEELLDVLVAKKLAQKVAVGPAQVEAITESCKNISGSCLSDTAFYKNAEITFTKGLLARGLKLYKLPQIKAAYCGADAINSYVVGPSGDFYKCWNEIGIKEKAIGNFGEDGEIKLNAKLTKWLAWDPFAKGICRECNLLPICMGGCPYKGLNLKRVSCAPWKFNLNEMLNLIYMSRLPRNQGKVV